MVESNYMSEQKRQKEKEEIVKFMQEKKTRPINKVKKGIIKTIKKEEEELKKAKEEKRKAARNSKEKEEEGKVINSPKEREDRN